MKINLPDDLERFVNDQVKAGRYATSDDLIREALERFRMQTLAAPSVPGHGSIGAMRDAAAELDEVVEHAMRLRLKEL